ncbi:acyl-CoA dehydrogenase family protein [Alcaligenes endophyticus]|uniref:Acyl-CoA dehydrogenase family protein n=1 Tax=Alcaligenes endophyticus TaxID=1929088 RepID=A0ABT8EJI1_9BURK|nr:acyl-CoA dehydrogenase family protein [Alcaligenes endophyticus]MCX5591754.1 acyl-CoA dehydrogenase family protein [Alcaligenes endophyticus]MDN4121431.1 acyl-CoA dehydrogenase family protein [Alcaligenes endophyticus]
MNKMFFSGDVFQASDNLDAFRQSVRRFVQQALPDDIRVSSENGQQLTVEQSRRWNRILAEQGLLVPHWPERWGGRAWSVAQQMVFDEEMSLADAPELNSVTFDMIGPILIQQGTPEQQARFLPAIASGEQWWCQGYSEPNSGSDLASIGTRAIRDKQEYVVTGSKIWTSYAQYADWMFCLVRSRLDGKPQEGITFLLIDMQSSGIEVRPIEGIHGWVVFNEVFLDQVRVPVQLRVGPEHQGWAIAKSLLQFERLKLARVGENKRRMARARLAGSTRKQGGQAVSQQPWFRHRYAELVARLMALEANAARFIARQQAGEQLGEEVSMLKMRGSQLIQSWEELIVESLGIEGQLKDSAWIQAQAPASLPIDALSGTASARRFLARGYTMAGGSSEILHNILAKKVLQL